MKEGKGGKERTKKARDEKGREGKRERVSWKERGKRVGRNEEEKKER